MSPDAPSEDQEFPQKGHFVSKRAEPQDLFGIGPLRDQQAFPEAVVNPPLQGYLAYKKQPPPVRTAIGP